MSTPCRVVPGALLSLLTACPADWPPLTCSSDECSTGGSPSTGADSSSSGGEEPTTTEGAKDGPSASTGPGDPNDTTGDEPAAPPEIVAVDFTPNPLEQLGKIDVAVHTKLATEVSAQLDSGKPLALGLLERDSFAGAIWIFSGLEMGTRKATFTPLRDGQPGQPFEAEFTVDVPPPGGQHFWETGALLGPGHARAVDVLPGGDVVELGGFFEDGVPACYLRRRDPNGGTFQTDFINVLPGTHCVPVDLKIDRATGKLRVLVNRKVDAGTLWWLGEISTWGQGVKNTAQGGLGETAFALAAVGEVHAVCGAKLMPTNDNSAAAWVFGTRLPTTPQIFEYQPAWADTPNKFDEVARDCVFADDLLVLVGEANGQHTLDVMAPETDRLFIAQLDPETNTRVLMVDVDGPEAQNRALSVAVDDAGRYLITTRIYDQPSAPDAEFRIYGPDLMIAERRWLGPVDAQWGGPHDIAWSPAGLVVLAFPGKEGPLPTFRVQAFAPDGVMPLWSFTHPDVHTFQVPLGLAIGEVGHVYVVGIGAGDFTAIAYVDP